MSCVTCHEWIFILLLVFLSVQGYNLRLLQRAHSRHVQSFARGLSSRPLSVLQDEKIESKVAPEYGNIIFTVAIKGKLQLELFQHTKAKIPRSYLPAILKLHVSNDQNPSDEEVLSLLQESILWYVEQGGKFTNMNIVCNRDQFAPLLNSGFVPSHSGSHDEFFYHPKIDQAISDFEQRTSEDTKKLFEQANIIGRLYHEHGLPLKSIDWLTKALSYNPRSSATFRNLGSSYLAAGQKKMAFASFQQAIELDPTDAMVYQKLGMFYEDFARENWKDAEENAEKCYRHYLAHVDQEDTAILLRLGNLLVSSNKPDRALEIFDKVISIDQSQVAAWFNRAHTQILLEQFEGAALSLQKALHLDPTLIEARHMIKALTGEKAVSMERAYVVKLFDEYAANYDQHVKSLFYSAPRVIRMELAKIYREKGAIKRPSQPSSDIETQFAASESPVDGSCTSYVSFMNNSLSILDLGCGTGQAGAWLKDYATTLVGVDVSPNMIEVARKKMLYQDLQITSMENYLAETTNTFDLIVAADSFAYVGELGEIVQKTHKTLNKGGLIAFTVESLDDAHEKHVDFTLTKKGRFAYAKSYLESLLNNPAHNYKILMSREYSSRMEAGNAVPGYLFIAEKS